MYLAGIYTSLFLCGRIPRYSLVPSLKEPELKRLSSEFGGNDEEWVPWAKRKYGRVGWQCLIARRALCRVGCSNLGSIITFLPAEQHKFGQIMYGKKTDISCAIFN